VYPSWVWREHGREDGKVIGFLFGMKTGMSEEAKQQQYEATERGRSSQKESPVMTAWEAAFFIVVTAIVVVVVVLIHQYLS
jgi:hypothetical protein